MTRPQPRKRFGQHFLNDGNIIRKIIANIAPAATDHFVEIGPGEGAITLPLLASGARLDAIEIDRDLARELPGRVRTGRCTVHCADALAFDFSSLAAPGEKLRLVGNLPYNISTPLLFHFLQFGSCWRDLHVMLQKEVGERIAADPGNKTYGRLTVALALRCRIEQLFGISPGSFRPPPQVDSVFLRLVPHPVALADPDTLSIADQLVAAAFGMRRKRLSNGLRGLATTAEIGAAGIDPGLRPEQLPPADWLQLGRFMAGLKPGLAKHGSPLPEWP